MTKKQEKQIYDLIIAGGGPIGMLMGNLSARQGLRVAIIDTADPKSVLDSNFDGRTTSIAYGSSLILQEAGVWPHVKDYCYPILSIRVADQKSSSHLDYHYGDSGDHPLGYMIENRFLRQGLYKKTQELANLRYYAPDSIKEFKRDEFKTTLALDSEVILEAPLCIAADGKSSTIRTLAGIETRNWDYDQCCIVFVASHSLPHQSRAYEHFHPNGPLATLPLDEHRSAIVWTEKKDLAEAMLSLPEPEFNDEFNRRFGDTLGKLTLQGRTWTYPLAGLLAKTLISHRCALIGDAGHSIHPVAGQGMNLGIRDAKALMDIILHSYELGLDIGSYTLLEQYNKARKGDIISMTAMTHGLVKLFSNDVLPLRQARSMGLAVVNKLPFTKRFLTRRAMGI